ncbi:PAS domain S-box protein [Acidovorax sp. NPDC077693]|uniref:hybrid sensor histidine kinase/response regulator n=1 Tax=unclassified Acidovorax TaxID=2684926 RepID=UPI0037CA6D0D
MEQPAEYNAARQGDSDGSPRPSERTWSVTPDVMMVADGAGRLLDVNPAWTRTLGWSREESLGRSFESFVHAADMPATQEAFRQLQRGEPVLRFENRYRAKDGNYRWLSWIAVPEGNEFRCSARDVTQDKTASEERSRLWALSSDMLARANYEGMMTAVNPAWTAVLGFAPEELLATPYVDFMHPEDAGVTLAALESMGQTGDPTRFENRIRSADGQWKHIEWTVSPEPGGVYFVAVGRDVSEQKARERELAEAQALLRQAQKMEAVGQLTGGIAHDFNNLLNAVSLNLEMLSRRVELGQYDGLAKYIGTAHASVKRGATLTQRLLAFSRRQTLDPKPTDVNRLVAGVEDIVRGAVGPSIHVDVVLADDLWPANVDASQLENSILNLCINARDAMLPEGGRLAIETANLWLDSHQARARELPQGEYISLAVSDTGSGMAPDVVARAFEPFFTTKPLGQGTGLGLSMVYGFVRQSGGQLRVQSEVGRGTTIQLYFPRHVGAVAAPQPLAADGESATGGGEVIVLIDDEEAIRVVAAEALGLAGYQVLQAQDGPSGLAVLQSGRRVDLLVTDVGLPGGMNGRQVADAARVVRPGLKVLFITGYAATAAVGNGHLDANMRVLTKPFEMAALANKIDELLKH